MKFEDKMKKTRSHQTYLQHGAFGKKKTDSPYEGNVKKLRKKGAVNA